MSRKRSQETSVTSPGTRPQCSPTVHPSGRGGSRDRGRWCAAATRRLPTSAGGTRGNAGGRHLLRSAWVDTVLERRAPALRRQHRVRGHREATTTTRSSSTSGPGLRFFGLHRAHKEPFRASALVSHLHWDHVQGIPFFPPLLSRERDSTSTVPRRARGRSEETVRSLPVTSLLPGRHRRASV